MLAIYFARHGESEANVTRTFSNRDLPHRLTQRGVEHAKELARLLAERGVDELWCSPVPRAVETAVIVGTALGLTYQVTDGLREYDVGRFEGTNADEGWAEYDAVMRAWLGGDHERRVGGGESLSEIVARLGLFLTGFLDAANDDRRVACIAHGGLYRIALPQLIENVSPQFAIANTLGYGRLIVAEVRRGSLWCLEWDGVTVKGSASD